jgi:carbonic anhydrase
MKALVAGPSGDMPALSSWLRHAEPSLRRGESAHAVTLDDHGLGGSPSLSEHVRLTLHNVLQQLEHLRRYRMVADAEARGELHVTGLYFDVGAAQVYLFDPATESFVPAGVQPAVTSES